MMSIGFMSIFSILYFVLIGVGVYAMVIFIRLAHRGIKALDIYIEKNTRNPLE